MARPCQPRCHHGTQTSCDDKLFLQLRRIQYKKKFRSALCNIPLPAPDVAGTFARQGMRPKKEPGPSFRRGRANTWRRPTLTGPVVPLPSALRRFTSGFGMGPGGSTTLWSPEGDPGVNGGVPFIPIPGLWGPGLCYTLLVIREDARRACLSPITYNQ